MSLQLQMTSTHQTSGYSHKYKASQTCNGWTRTRGPTTELCGILYEENLGKITCMSIMSGYSAGLSTDCNCNCKYDNLYSTVSSKLLLGCFTRLLTHKTVKLLNKTVKTVKSLCSV